ncbi:hypothetical protein ACEPAG_3460 [Sanghuangporus baumii]
MFIAFTFMLSTLLHQYRTSPSKTRNEDEWADPVVQVSSRRSKWTSFVNSLEWQIYDDDRISVLRDDRTLILDYSWMLKASDFYKAPFELR